jgi:hypothetical protein
MAIEDRQCGECTVCCSGQLVGHAYGNKFGPNPCVFLVEQKCAIYETRPQTCRNYQCAWLQGLLPEWMKPSKCNVLVSVEFDQDRKQFLKVMPKEQQDLTSQIIEHLDEWTKENNTYYRIVK